MIDAWMGRKVVDRVRPMIGEYVHSMVVCGSLRRNETKIKDLDIVCHAITHTQADQEALPGMDVAGVGGEVVDHLRQWVEKMAERRQMLFDGFSVDVAGTTHHVLRDHQYGIKVELYAVHHAGQVGAAVALRTGPAAVSKAYMDYTLLKHWHVHRHLLHKHEKGGRPGARVKCDQHLECPMAWLAEDEQTFFSHLGLGWVDPAMRDLAWVRVVVNEALKVSPQSTVVVG